MAEDDRTDRRGFLSEVGRKLVTCGVGLGVAQGTMACRSRAQASDVRPARGRTMEEQRMSTRARLFTAGTALVLATAVFAPVFGQGDRDTWLQQIASPDANVRQAAWLDAARYGAPAIPPLGKLMAGEDKGVARAARLAMEVIVANAGAPGGGGKRLDVSRALCDLVKTKQPATVRAIQIRMLALVGGDEVVPTLSGLLADQDVGDDARQALQRIPGQAATDALLAALDRATPEKKPGFINALAHRGATGIVLKLVQLASDANQDVRLAALAAGGRLGDPRGIPVVTAALEAPDAADRAAAADALLDLADARLTAGGKDVARRMFERVLRSNVRTGKRVAALTGIWRVDDPASLRAVLQSLGDRNPVFHTMAMALIDRFAGQDVVQVMKDVAQTASPAARAGLMLGLASRDDGTVAGTLREGLADPSDEVKAAAATGLGVIGDQDAAPALLRLAEAGNDPAKPAALNSYVKLLAARLAQSKDAGLLPLYNHALEIAAGAAERNLALAGLAAFGAPSSLKLVEPLTVEDPTREAALRAYVAIGRTLAAQGKADQAKTVFQNAIARGAPRDLAGEAAAHLRALGVQIDLAKESGFISNWWLVGAFPNPNQGGFDTVYPPEKEADPARPVPFEGKALAWKAIHTDDVQGIVDLERQFDIRNDVVAYACAVISVAQGRDVTLKIGSDDAVKVWVNSQEVHANNAYRPLTVDEDRAGAHLKAGDNTILMKITQGGGQWSYCLRIVGEDGKPLQFEQRAAR